MAEVAWEVWEADVLTVGQVASLLGLSRTHVQRLCDIGRLRCERNAFGVRQIVAADAEALRDELRRGAPATPPRPKRPRSPNHVVEHMPPLLVVLLDQGRTQRWLAARLGVPAWRLSRYRRGLGKLDRNPARHADLLRDAAALLGVPAETILPASEQ